MESSEIIKELHNSVDAQNRSGWEIGTWLCELWLRGDWKRGLNSRATMQAYWRYVFDKAGWDIADNAFKRRMEDLLELVTWWSRYDDEYIAQKIKEVGHTKPLLITKYMAEVTDPEVARQLLDMCAKTTYGNVEDEAYRIINPEDENRSSPKRGKNNTMAFQCLRHLELAPTRLINQEMFTPRQTPRKANKEISWWTLFDTYVRVNKDKVTDDIFEEMMFAWAKTLPVHVLEEAKRHFDYKMRELPATERGDFLFDDLIPGKMAAE
jgi:hypothetical protein